jgi:hypothetical protein
MTRGSYQRRTVAWAWMLPQAGQGACGVQLGDRVEAGREVLGRRPLPVSILLITSFETWTRTARSFWDRPARVR